VADFYLPSQCATCQRASLTPLTAAADVRCPKCGGQAQIIPGELYRAGDAALFDQIESATNVRTLSQTERHGVTAELSNVTERTRASEAMLWKIIALVPALRFLAGESQHDRLVHGLGMLLAIVTAQSNRFASEQLAPSLRQRSSAIDAAARPVGGVTP
jgi:hypothetical protein